MFAYLYIDICVYKATLNPTMSKNSNYFNVFFLRESSILLTIHTFN